MYLDAKCTHSCHPECLQSNTYQHSAHSLVHLRPSIINRHMCICISHVLPDSMNDMYTTTVTCTLLISYISTYNFLNNVGAKWLVRWLLYGLKSFITWHSIQHALEVIQHVYMAGNMQTLTDCCLCRCT